MSNVKERHWKRDKEGISPLVQAIAAAHAIGGIPLTEAAKAIIKETRTRPVNAGDIQPSPEQLLRENLPRHNSAPPVQGEGQKKT